MCAESYIQDHDDNDSREQSRTPLGHHEPGNLDTSRNAASPVADGVGKKVLCNKKL